MSHSLIQNNSPLDQMRQRRTAAVRSAPQTLSPRDRNDLADILSENLDYVDDELFHTDDAERQIFEDAPEIPDPNTSWYHPVMENVSNPRDVQGVVNVVLNKDQERALFLQFNYARFMLAQRREELGDKELSAEEAKSC